MTERREQIEDLRRQLAELEREEAEARRPDTRGDTSRPAHPRKRITSSWFFLIVISVLGVAFYAHFIVSPDKPIPSETAGTQFSGASTPIDPPPEPPWLYPSVTDPLTDRKTQYACITSINEVRLLPPYEDVKAELCLRNDPRHGRDVYVSLLGEGQMLYRSYQDGKVVVRFDDRPASTFSAVGAADGSSNVVFIRDRARFESALKTADKTLIEVSLYRAGQQVIEFHTSGFAWPKEPIAQ